MFVQEIIDCIGYSDQNHRDGNGLVRKQFNGVGYKASGLAILKLVKLVKNHYRSRIQRKRRQLSKTSSGVIPSG